MSAYIRFPAIFGDMVAFTAEDDLWTVSSQGGRAYRLTAGLAEATYPRFSPDGGLLAFVGGEEGPEEVYIMPADGGPARRLTYDAALCTVTTWSPDGAVIYASDARQPFNRRKQLHRVDTQGHTRPLPHGPANTIAYGPGDAVVLGRNTADPARWKRYRGGTVGDLWIDREGDGHFARLIALAGNLASPCWAGDRVYFLSDHEGIGNVYSCTPTGTGLRRHTDHGEYYARNLSSDGTRLVYHSAGDLYLLDPAEGEPRRLDVRLGSSRTQRNRRFASATRYLDSARLAPDGSGLAVTTRGKAYSFGNWEGPVRQHGEPDGVRYRLLSWLPGHDRLIAAASDDTEWETLVVLTADGSADPVRLTGLDTGRAISLEVSPAADRVALANHRNQLLIVDLPTEPGGQPALTVADHSPYSRITGLTWSPEGDWLAYACPDSAQTTAIKLYQTTTGRTHRVTRPVLRDGMPAFDPEGRYLYFIGERVFNPVYDSLQFDLGFPLGTRPYAVTLRDDVPSPFVPEPRPLTGDDTGKKTSRPGPDQDDTEDETTDGTGNDTRDETEDETTEDEGLRIDLDGIERRVIAFPVPEGRYHRIAGLKDKVLFTVHQVTGSRADGYADHTGATLQSYDLRKHKLDTVTGDVSDFRLGHDGTTLLLRSGNRLRVVKAGDTPPDDDATTRASGWIDLDRVKVSVLPDAEWRQMFREAWRLQREHFWAEDMAGIDWDGVYRRYLPLVDKITTRGEFSDLLWELHGELGTSHAYEGGGEYRESPHYWQGLLGADTEYRDGAHVITHIVHGDPWDPEATSPSPGPDSASGQATPSSPSTASPPPTPKAPHASWSTRPTRRSNSPSDAATPHPAPSPSKPCPTNNRPATANGWRTTGPASTNAPRAASATCTSPTWARSATPSSTAASSPNTTARAWWWTSASTAAATSPACSCRNSPAADSATTTPAGGFPSPTPPSPPAARWSPSPTSSPGPTATSSATPSNCSSSAPWSASAPGVASSASGPATGSPTAPSPPSRSSPSPSTTSAGAWRTTAPTPTSRWTSPRRSTPPASTPSWNAPSTSLWKLWPNVPRTPPTRPTGRASRCRRCRLVGEGLFTV